MAQYHIAQVNIARLSASLEDPIMRGFIAFLSTVNALADTAPGFVWRYQSDYGDATSLRVYDDDRIIVNFTVWESVESLKNFVYKGDHAYVMQKRLKWFEKNGGAIHGALVDTCRTYSNLERSPRTP